MTIGLPVVLAFVIGTFYGAAVLFAVSLCVTAAGN